MSRPSASLRQVALLAALLGFQFALRSVNITAQEAFVDEGYHVQRATLVWSFQQNPGQFSEGKLLLYFWLGLFQGSRTSGLVVSRLSIALFSLVTGAGVYAVTRRLYGDRAGLIALGLYTVMPLSVFFEPMALADPFVAGLAALVAWRSLIFARHPSRREGLLLGVLIALAKLTLVLIPLLPVAAALVDFPWRRAAFGPQARRWIGLYLWPLVLAACVVSVFWLPVLVPAYLARNGDTPFALVNITTLRTEETTGLTGLPNYLTLVTPLIADFVSYGLLIAAGLALAGGLLVGYRRRKSSRPVLFVAVLLIVTTAASILLSGLPTTRYFVPAAIPLCIVVGGAATSLWNARRARGLVRLALVTLGGLWLATFALPLDRTVLAAPLEARLSVANHYEYQSGAITGDEAVQGLARFLNSATLPRLFANWELCSLLYFYVDRPIHLLHAVCHARGAGCPVVNCAEGVRRGAGQPGRPHPAVLFRRVGQCLHLAGDYPIPTPTPVRTDPRVHGAAGGLWIESVNSEH